MNVTRPPKREWESLPGSHSELLLLPDGRILVHNLTKTMAALLQELNPREDTIRPRAEVHPTRQNLRPLVA